MSRREKVTGDTRNKYGSASRRRLGQALVALKHRNETGRWETERYIPTRLKRHGGHYGRVGKKKPTKYICLRERSEQAAAFKPKVCPSLRPSVFSLIYSGEYMENLHENHYPPISVPYYEFQYPIGLRHFAERYGYQYGPPGLCSYHITSIPHFAWVFSFLGLDIVSTTSSANLTTAFPVMLSHG